MANKDISQTENCPFWSALSMKCRICKDGLFIPLDDHINGYCKTPDYIQCLSYTLHPENHLERDEKSKLLNESRRKFARIEACHKITVVKLVHSGTVVSHFSSFAKTLDLSNGGMRLTTNRPLANNTVVQFLFGKSFPQDLQEGSGQVAWCNKEIDNPGYQAGIAFHDDRIIKAMALYLDLHHRNAMQ
ncbi:MAG: PilZ domain-containing protein [Pseudomonadota bacterium]